MPTKVSIKAKKKFKNAVMLTGLPGIGLVGKIALDHLISQLNPKEIGEVFSDSFPPSVQTHNALLELIKNKVYARKVNGTDFLFLAGPVQPTLDFRAGSAQEHYEFAESIVQAVKTLGVKEVYTLAGLNVGQKRLNSEPKIVIAATGKKILEQFKEFGVISDKSDSLISGAAGLLLGVAKEQGLQGACLMGETNAQLLYGDHASAKKLLEVLVKKFKFKVSMKEIDKEAKGIEQAFTKLAKQLQEQQQAEGRKDNLSYVR